MGSLFFYVNEYKGPACSPFRRQIVVHGYIFYFCIKHEQGE